MWLIIMRTAEGFSLPSKGDIIASSCLNLRVRADSSLIDQHAAQMYSREGSSD